MNKKIKLTNEKREFMISAIQNFFLQERDEDLGDLAATLILDFFIEELGSEIYNQGVFDSYNYMQDRVEDLLTLQK